MTIIRNYLEVDLSAESGCAIVSTLADGNITLTETYCFFNDPVFNKIFSSIEFSKRFDKFVQFDANGVYHDQI